MRDWKMTTIAECSTILGDGLHGTPKYDENGEYAFINGNNLHNGKIVIKRDTKRVGLSEYEKHKKELTDRTVLVSINGTLGNVAVYNGEKVILGKSACYFNVSTDCDVQFMRYVVSSPRFQQYINSVATGTTIKNVSLKQMREYSFPIPELKEQQRIAKVLHLLDQKIENNRKINDNLLEQLDALYQEFSTRDTWDTIPIGDLADKIAMGPFGSNIKVSTFVSSGVPIISGNHLRGYFLEEPSYNYITEEHAERLKNSVVYPGDIVFTHAGNIGQVALIPDGCDYSRYVLSQRQFYLRCNKEKILPEYVTLFFHSAEGQHELLSYANQTGVPSLAQPASNLKKIALPVPPIHIQEEWAVLVRPLISLYQRNRLESRALATIRDILLPKLMSGEIDVSDIQM